MKKTMNRMIIGAVALLLAVPVFASDGAIAAWRRDTSGTLTSGIDADGKLVAPGMTLAGALTATSISGAINGTNITSGNIPEAQMTNGLATTIGLAASALQPNTIVVSGATSAVDTAAITVSNGLGAASTVVGIWSAATNGAASTANLISLVATTGTLLSETNSATIVIVTDATGYAALTATVSAATTNYAAFVQNNGVRVSSDEMVFDGP